MTTYSQSDLATRVLRDLGLIGAEEVPSAADLQWSAENGNDCAVIVFTHDFKPRPKFCSAASVAAVLPMVEKTVKAMPDGMSVRRKPASGSNCARAYRRPMARRC